MDLITHAYDIYTHITCVRTPVRMSTTGRPCTPLRHSASTNSSCFVLRPSPSNGTTERSCTPFSSPTRGRDSWGHVVDAAAEARVNSMVTPRATRAEPVHSPAALCTPQTLPEELRLRAALDAELARVKSDAVWWAAPAVTPLVEGLYVGAFPDEETLEILRQEKIDIIVNCCAGEYDTPDSVREEFVVHHLNAEDQNDYLILYHCYERFAAIVQDATRLGRRVFVHCVAGINRSVTLCFAYIMQYHHMDLISCVQHFRAQGRIDILRNVSFRHQLVDFYLHTL